MAGGLSARGAKGSIGQRPIVPEAGEDEREDRETNISCESALILLSLAIDVKNDIVMTAIVGILNKQAVAVAADSAVTVGGGTKIYNTANKIFNLSKGCPVGIAIYGNAALNSCVPWEVVIKMYRKHIGSNKFATLSEYMDDFFNYVRNYTKKYISDEDALNVLKRNLLHFWCVEITQGLRESDDPQSPIAKPALPILLDKLTKLDARLKKEKILSEYKAVTPEDFVKAIEEVLEIIKNQISANGGKWKDEFEAVVEDCLYRLSVTNNPFSRSSVSGVAIFGYGEDEIYPSLHEQQVYNMVLGRLRISPIPDNNTINETNGASICPMAQRDVIETFIEGVSNKIKNTFLDATATAIKKTVNDLSAVTRPHNPALADAIKGMDYSSIIDQYRVQINSIIRRDQVVPLIQTIVSMGKEDIADLAENLIYMTSMKRHVTPYAETVGGPIDVAIISKGDGFIWEKRKHYFSPELNRTFFDTQQ